MALPADQPHRGCRRQRDVRETFHEVAGAAIAHRAAFEVVAGGELGGIGLVADDAQRACLRARSVQRALRSSQRLDARDVVQMHVERALNGRDWLLVQVDTDARQ
jgi:hypothetical protein